MPLGLSPGCRPHSGPSFSQEPSFQSQTPWIPDALTQVTSSLKHPPQPAPPLRGTPPLLSSCPAPHCFHLLSSPARCLCLTNSHPRRPAAHWILRGLRLPHSRETDDHFLKDSHLRSLTTPGFPPASLAAPLGPCDGISLQGLCLGSYLQLPPFHLPLKCCKDQVHHFPGSLAFRCTWSSRCETPPGTAQISGDREGGVTWGTLPLACLRPQPWPTP